MNRQVEALRLALVSASGYKGCMCHACAPPEVKFCTMLLCPDCGNKRCPKANDHRNACTNSNATGQKGSAYR